MVHPVLARFLDNFLMHRLAMVLMFRYYNAGRLEIPRDMVAKERIEQQRAACYH